MWEKIKLIFKSLREYKVFAIVTPLFMIGEALLECFLPFLMSILVDIINTYGPEMSSIADLGESYQWTNVTLGLTINVNVWVLIGILVGSAFLSLFCGIMGGYFGSKASVGLAANLRMDLYKKIESFSFANIDKFSVSSLVTRMTTDITNVQQAFQMTIRAVFRSPLLLIFSAIMAFISGGNLAWVFIVLIPIIGVGLFFILKYATRIFRRVFKRYDALNESVQENVSAIRVVKSFVREDYEKEKFETASSNITQDFIKAEKIVALNNPLMNTSIHLANIIIIGVGSYLVYQTDLGEVMKGWSLSVGQLSSLLTYGVQILTSLMMISMIMVMLSMSLEGIERIGEVLLEEPTLKNCENPLYEVEDGSIDFNHVNFKYNQNAEKDTLENIDIHIKSGEFVGILGSTGSGKTSLVNLISRLYDVEDGEVLVGGKNVKEYDLKTLRDNVSVVLQKNVLFSGTIATNLRWGDKEASDEELVEACKIAQADEFIQQFPEKYDSPIEQGGTNVSGGQKQRLCIARAILKKPKILILDDSTSAVDTKTDRLIRKGLKEDIPETTKIVIAQRISSIEDADQIIIMDDGKINAIGTHDELIKSNKIYQEVYYTQNNQGGEQ